MAADFAGYFAPAKLHMPRKSMRYRPFAPTQSQATKISWHFSWSFTFVHLIYWYILSYCYLLKHKIQESRILFRIMFFVATEPLFTFCWDVKIEAMWRQHLAWYDLVKPSTRSRCFKKKVTSIHKLGLSRWSEIESSETKSNPLKFGGSLGKSSKIIKNPLDGTL